MCDDDFLDLRCLLRGGHTAPSYRYCILYLGANRALLITYLNRELKEISCFVSYVPAVGLEHTFIKSVSRYDLLLFDERMPGTTGAELVAFTRTVPHRASTPCIIVPTDATPENSRHLVEQIKRLLAPI